MFDLVQPIASSPTSVTDDDVDRIEQTYACHLPSDYRAFLTTFGPGTLEDGIWTPTEIFSPAEVIERTAELRALLREPGEEPPWHLLFFDLQEDAATYFTPTDIERFIAIAGDAAGSTSIIVPGDPAHYYELPHEAPVGDAGATMDELLAYLDPRVRYEPHARRIVENGRVRETDGRPDGTPWIFQFVPQGYTPAERRSMVEQEITWGHEADGLVTWSLSRVDIGQRPTAIQFHMEHYPLLALLEAIALRDPSTRFEAQESDIPTAWLTVPRFGASLRADGGMEGLTLYITAPEEQVEALDRWLLAETRALGYDAPPGLIALVAG